MRLLKKSRAILCLAPLFLVFAGIVRLRPDAGDELQRMLREGRKDAQQIGRDMIGRYGWGD